MLFEVRTSSTLHAKIMKICFSWRRSIVGRTLGLGRRTFPILLSYTRLLAGRVTALWLRRPLPVSQHGQLNLPPLRGRLMSSNPVIVGYGDKRQKAW